MAKRGHGRASKYSAYTGGPIVYAGVPPLAARSRTPVTSGAPGGVSAVLANITMTESTGGGYVTADDRCDRFDTTPNKSNGNFNAGQNIANLGVVRLGPDSGFCLFNESPVHLLADVQGYFSSGGKGSQAILSAVDARSGKILWQERSIEKATFVWADGKLITLAQDGTLMIAHPSPQGFKIAAKAQLLSSLAWTAPTLVGTRAYLRDRQSMVAVDLG